MWKLKIFSIVSLMLFLASCKKEFLDTYPTNAVAATEAVATTKNG